MIKAVIFDADGVLINGEMFSVHLARDYGISTEKTKSFFEGEFKDCIIGKADLKELLPKHLKEWGWEKSLDAFLDYWFKSEHNIDEPLVTYINELKEKGIKVYLATNQEKYRTQYLIDRMGLGEVFDKVYSSAHIGHRKPNHDFFNFIVKDLNRIEKDEVLFWDNSLANVETAKEFGINAEFYTSFDDFKDKMTQFL